MNVTEALEQYLMQLEADGRSVHTLAQARRHVERFAAFVGTREIGEIGHQDVARFLTSALAVRTSDGRVKKPTSMNAMRSSLRAFLAFVHAAGYAPLNAARLVRRARTGTTTPRGVTPAEREALVATLASGSGAAAARDRVFFGLLLATGIRLGSALALDVEDLDLVEGVARLRTLKGGGSHTVYLPEVIVAQLREHVGQRHAGPLFCGRGSERLGARQAHRRLSIVARKAGITRAISPHALRHSFALSLYEKCGDVLVVQAALGHRSIASTICYAQASAARVREALRTR